MLVAPIFMSALEFARSMARKSHQVGSRGLGVGIGPDQPCIRLRFDNRRAAWRCGLDALVDLGGCLNLQVGQRVDLNCPFHRILSSRVCHVDEVSDLR